MAKKNLLLALIVISAFLLRVVALDRYPTGFTADEAAQGYTAYSILQTGRDEWGVTLPLNPRSFGDFKPPVYTYLTIPSIAIFGLNEFAVRLPSAIFGTLAVFFTYLLAKKLTNDERVGLLAALFLTVSPWHLSLSRGAYEANLSTSIVTLAIYLFLSGLSAPTWFIPASFLFGINMFTYHSAKVVTPLLVLALVFWKRDQVFRLKKALAVSASILGIMSLAVAAGFFSGAGSRAADLAIFHPTGGWTAISERRFEAIVAGAPDGLARLFSNKVTYIASTFSKNYLQYFSVDFLFGEGAGEGTYGMVPGRGVLYFYEVITLGFALYMWITRRLSYMSFLFLWLVLAAVPPAMAKGSHAANRFAVSMPAWQILSAIGAVGLYEMLKRYRPLLSKYAVLLFSGAVMLFFAFFLETYLAHAPVTQAAAMHDGWKEAAAYIRDHENEYDYVYVSRKLSEPQAFLAFYLPIMPVEFQKYHDVLMEYERQGKPFLDQLGSYTIGKYVFEEIPKSIDPKERVLYVGTLDELHDARKAGNEIYEIKYPDDKPAFMFVTKVSKPL